MHQYRSAFIVLLLASGGSVGAVIDRPAQAQEPRKSNRPLTSVTSVQSADLTALIKLVDEAAAGLIPAPDVPWRPQIFRATNTINYVPFTLDLPPDRRPKGAITLYVRVATRIATTTPTVEQSALAKWLQAGASRPLPPRVGGFVSVPTGEMPVGGPALSFGRSEVAVGAQESFTVLALSLKELEKEQEKLAKEKAEEKRLQDTDGFVHPFEDFDFIEAARSSGDGGAFARAVAVAPGDYDLYLAWSPQGAVPAGPRSGQVVRQRLTIPDLQEGELGASSVIVASRLTPVETPPIPERQTAHPYVLGTTQVVPATTMEFGDDDPFSVVFQVYNPLMNLESKPDVTIEYRFHRAGEAREDLFAETAPQVFNKDTLPLQFSAAAGHQLLVIQSVPLTTFPAGDYRLEIAIKDNLADRDVTKDIAFSVVGSPAALFKAAPPLAPAFRREEVLQPAVIKFFLDRLPLWLGGPVPPAYTAALDHARAGRFSSVLAEVPVAPGDQVVPTFLRGLALLAINDSAEPAAAQFRAALASASDFLPAAFYLGSCYAVHGREREAVGAWQIALISEESAPFMYTALADAFLRQGEAGQAGRILTEATSRWPEDEGVQQRVAAVAIAGGRDAEALGLLDARLQRRADDPDALFLATRALFGAYANGRTVRSATDDRERFARYARAYLATGGPERRLVTNWLKSFERREAVRP